MVIETIKFLIFDFIFLLLLFFSLLNLLVRPFFLMFRKVDEQKYSFKKEKKEHRI